MTLEFNAKLAESFFLFRRQVSFDGTQEKLMAHLMKVGVREKIINRQVQTFDCVCFAPALERLLYRNELVSESKSRNRMARVNLENDFPVFSIQHVIEKSGASLTPLTNKVTTPRPHTFRARCEAIVQSPVTYRVFGNAGVYIRRATNTATRNG